MTKSPSMARISRISFCTDMTRASAFEILLGFMLEAVWPDQARWLGLIGRTRLSSVEIKTVNLATWPEFEKPFGLLDRMFDQAWESAWGNAGVAAQQLWTRTSLIVQTDQHNQLLLEAKIDTDSAWASTVRMLDAQLTHLGEKLIPLPPHPQPMPKRRPSVARGLQIPEHVHARGRRIQEESAHAT
jgi:hypothetical protein